MALDGLYAWLGFSTCKAPMPKNRPGFASGCGSCRQVFVLPWRDRLRALVSGKVMVDIALQMDRVPKRFETTGAMSVLPPNYSVDGPQ